MQQLLLLKDFPQLKSRAKTLKNAQELGWEVYGNIYIGFWNVDRNNKVCY